MRLFLTMWPIAQVLIYAIHSHDALPDNSPIFHFTILALISTISLVQIAFRKDNNQTK